MLPLPMASNNPTLFLYKLYILTANQKTIGCYLTGVLHEKILNHYVN